MTLSFLAPAVILTVALAGCRPANDGAATNGNGTPPRTVLCSAKQYRLAGEAGTAAKGFVGIQSIIETELKWPNGSTLRVYFYDGAAKAQERVLDYAAQWTKPSGIKFQKASSATESDIRVSFRTAGYSSSLGRDALNYPDKVTMSLQGLDTSTSEQTVKEVVLHEFGHALGLMHEHQHPDADIQWDREAVYRYYHDTLLWRIGETDSNVLMTYTSSTSQYSTFDPTSIMIYAIPPHFTRDGFSVGWASDLSETDTNFIKTIYHR